MGADEIDDRLRLIDRHTDFAWLQRESHELSPKALSSF